MSLSPRVVRLAVAGCVTLAVGGFCGARYVATSHARAQAQARPATEGVSPTLELHVPHAKGSIVLDGDMDDPGWLRETARTNAFIGEDGVSPARPYSDARLAWGDGHLYIALYAADENILATQTKSDEPLWLEDSFHLTFSDRVSERVFDVSALGTLTDGARTANAATPFDYAWQSGAHVSKEVDGTPNDPSDDDEEWAIEMAIPFEALGLKGERGERIRFSVRRCDTPKRAKRACGSWGASASTGVLVLD